MADPLLIRCSSLGKIMTEPTAAAAKAGEVLSVGAKTYLRELAAQEILSVEFTISGKELEKGIRLEPEAIALRNRVRGESLVKNTERRSNGLITGECDLFNPAARRGHDTKVSWSAKTFPIVEADCVDAIYEWQAHGYMALWEADEWTVDYVLLNTPEDLIGYEPFALHVVDHLPEFMRLTSWTIKRDEEKQRRIEVKVKAARAYLAEVMREFDRTHRGLGDAAPTPPWEPAAAPPAPKAPAPAPAGPVLLPEELPF